MALKTLPKKPAAAPKAAPKTTQTGPVDELTGRPVKYTDLTVCGVLIPEENLYATAADAKALLGWETEQEHEDRLTKDVSPEVASKMNVKYGDQYDLKSYSGEKVCCNNNTRNRPLQMPWVDIIAQEILNERWEFNGEAWIIGQTGLALSLQHRAHGLIRAQEILDYAGDDEDKKAKAEHWQKVWGKDHELKIPALIVRGVKESPSVTRTLDNCRPRTLSDVLFADTSLFNKTARADRETLCKLTDYAIRTVWDRAGVSDDAFSPHRTHAESLEFLTAHPRLLKAVNHIFTEINRKNDKGEKTNVMKEYCAPGTAAGLMFLMGASASDRQRWDNADSPNDRHLDFANWDLAEAFWTGIGDPKNQATFGGVWKAIANCGNAATGAKAPTRVKVAALVNAWNEFKEGSPMTIGAVTPAFGDPDDYGNRPLKGMPSIGGVDLGDWKADKKEREAEEAAAAAAEEAANAAAAEGTEEGEEAEEPTGPSEAELAALEARKEEEKKRSLAAKAAAGAKPKGLRGGVSK